MHDLREKLAYACCYASAPLADIAVNDGPTWVTLAGLACAAGGLACHAIQTWIKWREHEARINRRV
jgi:hypothetical protein